MPNTFSQGARIPIVISMRNGKLFVLPEAMDWEKTNRYIVTGELVEFEK